MGILFTGRASILVNGAPTKEFELKRGLRQGDPLSPFLFTIVMEALHVMMAKAVEAGIYKGVVLPNGGPTISHLFYADDALFIGECSESNLRNLSRILRCFFVSSGLKVNFDKSKLYGVGVDIEGVKEMAGSINCQYGEFPFVYLGLPVGAQMNRITSWKAMVDKFNSKLSAWKAKSLSFAGRVTLVKSVLGSLAIYYLSLFKAPSGVINTLEGIRRKFLWGGASMVKKIRWVAWERILSPKKKGGLGVGGIRDLNLGLIAKWWRRYRQFGNQLWAKVLTSIHSGRMSCNVVPVKNAINGLWKAIVGVNKEFNKGNIDLNDSIVCAVGRGDKARFWYDNWTQQGNLKNRFPLLFAKASNKEARVCDNYSNLNAGVRWEVGWKSPLQSAQEVSDWRNLLLVLGQQALKDETDKWMWKTGRGNADFSVRLVRSTMGESFNSANSTDLFVWSKIATPKVNCFAWRAISGGIPTAAALAVRNVCFGDGMCILCGIEAETTDHLLVSCTFAKSVWWLICVTTRFLTKNIRLRFQCWIK
ncbi:putative RNA-directed DNA polymerase [Helianthus annuus]|nr:putative RNA-directed DNA polymerase [Helianthus annuus]